jgi:hypothetical protein
MHNDSLWWLPMQYRHIQSSVNCRFGQETPAERITDNLTIEEFHDYRFPTHWRKDISFLSFS